MARCDGSGRIYDELFDWTTPCPGCPACLVKGEAPESLTVTRHYITRAGHVIPITEKADADS